MHRLHVMPWSRLWVVLDDGKPGPLLVRPAEEEALIEARWLLHREPEWELKRYGADGSFVGCEALVPMVRQRCSAGEAPSWDDVGIAFPPVIGDT